MLKSKCTAAVDDRSRMDARHTMEIISCNQSLQFNDLFIAFYVCLSACLFRKQDSFVRPSILSIHPFQLLCVHVYQLARFICDYINRPFLNLLSS